MGVSSQSEPARKYDLGCALKSCGSAYETLVPHSQDTSKSTYEVEVVVVVVVGAVR